MAIDWGQAKSGISSFGNAASSFGGASSASASAAAEDLLARGVRLQGAANIVEADAYKQSGELSRKGREIAVANRGLIQADTATQLAVNSITAAQEERALFLTQGRAVASAASAGLGTTGSALDIIRDNARMGEITQQLMRLQGTAITRQGEIDLASQDQQIIGLDQQIIAYDTQEKSARTASEISEINALAHEANAAGLRSSSSAQKTGGVLSAIGGIVSLGLSIFCWVAREAYGEDNPRWLEFRAWMLNCAPMWLFTFYMLHGRNIAAWLKPRPWAKWCVRKAMDLTLAIHRWRAKGEMIHA
jgi:hypothetical protein